MKIIIVCRHGEAYKNLKNIYGGDGSGLTENGKKQILELSENIYKIQDFIKLPLHIYKSCNRAQVNESAEMMKKILKVEDVVSDSRFKPIRLGVFDGMSREKQLQLYPKACEAHQKWEQGLIDITESEKLIEGSQPALEYYNQIKSFMDELDDMSIYILVGTRSDTACIHNVFQDNSPEKYMCYRYYNYGYAEANMLLVNDEKRQMISMNEALDRIEQKQRKKPKVEIEI